MRIIDNFRLTMKDYSYIQNTNNNTCVPIYIIYTRGTYMGLDF